MCREAELYELGLFSQISACCMLMHASSFIYLFIYLRLFVLFEMLLIREKDGSQSFAAWVFLFYLKYITSLSFPPTRKKKPSSTHKCQEMFVVKTPNLLGLSSHRGSSGTPLLYRLDDVSYVLKHRASGSVRERPGDGRCF